MFIKSLLNAVDRLIHKGKVYPVVNGIADVPEEVRNEVISHPHWQDAVEEIDKKTITALDKAQKVLETVENDLESPEKVPPDVKNSTETK